MPTRRIDHAALELLAQSSTDAVLVLDQDGHLCLANTAAQAAFGLTPEHFGQPARALASLAPAFALVEQALTTHAPARWRLTLPDRRRKWVQVLYAPQMPIPLNTVGIAGEIKTLIHELKRPLSSAKSNIDMIQALGSLAPTQQEFARKAQAALLGMLHQIHQLEDLAWLDTSGQLQADWIDLNVVVHRALVFLDDYAHHQGVTIVLDLPPEGCPVYGDARRLENAIANLIHNAIKYSPDGGQVRIVLKTLPDTVELSVIDQGLGVAPEHLPHVFDETYRVHTEATAQIEGSGMGLAIVSAVIQMHQGKVFAASGSGKGSTFGFQLPYVPQES